MESPLDGGPDWVRDGVRQFADELRAFVRTAVVFTLHPLRFGRGWVAPAGAPEGRGGDGHALNPLGFLATALAILGGAKTLFNALVSDDKSPEAPESLAHAIAAALLPFVYYVLVGLGAHLLLRSLGSRRRWRDSCAMALYAGGGPALMAELLALTLAWIDFRVTGKIDTRHGLSGAILTFSILGAFIVYCITLATSLAGLHGVRAWKSIVALLTALLASALIFGAVHPPGHYGLHPVFVVSLRRGANFDFSLSD